MTALNRYLTAVAAMLLACLPALGQQPGESAETDLRKAQTLHKAYEFAKAEEYYSKALELTRDSLQKLDIMDKIIQCRNGESLLQYITRPSAVTSGIFSKEDFYLYLQDLDERSWIPIPNPFIKPAGGLRHPYYTAMYLPSGQQTVIFSAPDGTGAWNLYTSTRKDSTTWSVPELLSENILSGRNEIFPLLSRDGRTLYFASDGMPGMGGYDLFVTRYNMNSDTYLAPEQLGMPFNSPYNDYMMVYDEVKGLGWFVSDRFQPEGKACVYLFIPNETHSRVETEDIEVKRARAAICSIQESWVADADYSGQIQLAHEAIPYGKPKIEKDFEFVIQDDKVYYTWDEIKSPEAKSIYQKAVALKKEIAVLEKKLDALRMDYTAAASTGRKEQIGENILNSEEKLNNLLPQVVELEKQARNAEIIYVNK